MSKKFRTHYDNLGVSRNAQSEVIKAAYKALAQKYHPDRNPNNPDAERIMKIINTAYQVLIDPVRRAEHDRWIDEQEAKIYNQSTQNQNNSSENHKNQSNNQDYYDNSYTKNHQTQSTTNQRYDYTGSNNTRNNNANRQNNHAKYQNYQETYAKEKPSFWSFGRMRRTTYALLSIPTLFVWMIIRIGMEGAVSSMDDYDIATLFFMTMIELIPLYFLVFIGIKRLHDCDYKGWWILIPFVICVIWFVRPTQGTNRFGTNPRDSYADDEAETEEDYSFFGVIVVSIFINLAMISNINSQQNESNNTNNTARDGYQKPIQNLPQTSTIQTSAPNNPQQTLDTVQLLNQTRLDYKNAVAEINRVWEQLHPSVQDYLKDEQVEFNKQRESHCKEQSLTLNVDNNGREAYRYHCATQLLNERIAHLKTQINTVISSPLNNIPSKDEFILSAMMNIYNNPESAPPINICQSNIYCNAFSALSQYWIDIPDDYRYKGQFNIKYQAQIGDGYGLNKGFTLNQEQSILLAEGGDLVYYNSGGGSPEQEKIFAEGLVVLLYIEEMNGWL